MMNFSNQDIFNKFPTLSIDDIILRKINLEEDYIDFFHYITYSEVAKYLSKEDCPKDFIAAKEELGYWAKLFEYRHSFYWAIAEKENNIIIGTCGFNNWNRGQRRCEISYDLNYKYWGRGIMTKAIDKISEFAFEEMNIQRIQATVALDNMASIKVLEKTGFQKESILKNYGVLQDKTKDFFMYSKII